MSPIKLGADQTVFWCTACGGEVQRTRDDPYPEMEHKPGCPEDDSCPSTRTNVHKDTPGTKYGTIKGRKPRRNRVRSADKTDERSSRRR